MLTTNFAIKVMYKITSKGKKDNICMLRNM